MTITPRIICPKCELAQAAAPKCKRCEIEFSYPISVEVGRMVKASEEFSLKCEQLLSTLNFEAGKWCAVSASIALPAEAQGEEIGTMFNIEREAILAAVKSCDGDAQAAAIKLGIGKTTIYRKLKEYGKEVV